MKKERLLNLLGDIDGKYVEEATPGRSYRRQIWVKIGTAAACLVLVTAAALSLRGLTPQPDIEPEATHREDPRPDDPDHGDNRLPDGPSGEDYMAPVSWNGLQLTGETYEKLQSADPDTPVTLFARCSVWDLDFVFEGKTIREWEEEAEARREEYGRMGGLIKEGEDLKYGEALTTTGKPDGERWAEELYQERVNYYGDLLEKYIINGEFLKDELEADIAALDPNEGYEQLNRAVEALHTHMVGKLYGHLAGLGFACDLSADGQTVTLTATPAQLAALRLPEDLSETICFGFPRAQGEPGDLISEGGEDSAVLPE